MLLLKDNLNDHSENTLKNMHSKFLEAYNNDQSVLKFFLKPFLPISCFAIG
jgi:hypothetical protein